jgi:hypothetical protein
MSREKRIQRLGKDFTAATAQRSCFEKRVFESRLAARDFNARLAKRIPDRAEQTPYHCQVCGKWHLTSLTKQASAESRRRNFKGRANG